MSQEPGAFTVRTRKRKTRPSVLLADKVSRGVITVGGIGTILAVVFIVGFLVWIVAPLFGGADLEAAGSVPRAGDHPDVLRVRMDEFQVGSWEIDSDGVARVRRLDSGAVVLERRIFLSGELTAVSTPVQGTGLAFGLRDGSVVLGTIAFETAYHEPGDESLPEDLRHVPPGALREWDGGLVERTPAGQIRVQRLAVDLDPPIHLEPPSPVVGVDRTERTNGMSFCAVTGDGRLHVREIQLRPNLMTGKVRRTVRGADLEIAIPAGKSLPDHVVMLGLADNVVLLWKDGLLVRYSVRDLAEPQKAEVCELLGGEIARVTAVTPLIGKSTILVGDDRSRVRSWFLANSPTRETVDGMALVLGYEFDAPGGAVSKIAPSSRSHTIAVGYDDGRVRLYFVTSHKSLGEVRAAGAIRDLSLAPRDDGLLAITDTRRERWHLEIGHPEATVDMLFGKILYEGYSEPEYRWQTSGASDAVEVKLSLVPLVFGTLKATLYSMLFAVPLALLAAIYTSEFLHPRIRQSIKSVVEIMASLPSVVLGFVAAFVIAPFVEEVIPTTLLVLLTVPFVLLLAANLWQLVPRRTALWLGRYRLVFISVAIPAGVALAFLLGPPMERVFFAGNVKAWLDGQIGTGAGAWALLLLPLGVLIAGYAFPRIFGRNVRRYSEAGAARYSLVRFLAVGAGAFAIAGLLGWLLTLVGSDPRGGLMGTYVQRNAFVVGFAMGFAVIPIIYTIAEDALSAVPEHLRAASLGSGATPWQTAIRVIVPTAASGLFSACMIGLGRAVGETMIVLMAAGSTPIMDWSVFKGFETLSAAIATEMPEAVRDSTHFRILFLAGLVLFVMTFVVNTVAEAVRIRFRRRAFQL